jgi:hypothetical protein
MFDYNNNFGCSFVMVWGWAGHTVGTTPGLGLGQLLCGNNTWFVTGPVTLWEEDSLRMFENEAGEDIKS